MVFRSKTRLNKNLPSAIKRKMCLKSLTIKILLLSVIFLTCAEELEAQSKFFSYIKKKLRKYFKIFICIIMIMWTGNVAGRGILRRNYTGKKPALIQHRTPDAANYYDHENVRLCIAFKW